MPWGDPPPPPPLATPWKELHQVSWRLRERRLWTTGLGNQQEVVVATYRAGLKWLMTFVRVCVFAEVLTPSFKFPLFFSLSLSPLLSLDNGVKYAVVNKRRLRDRPATPFEHPVPRGERPATPYENPYHVLQDPNALPPPLPPRSTSSSPKLPPRSDHMTSHVTSHSSNIAPSISPKPPRRSGQMINHMTPPSPNNSAKSSPNTNHKVSHLTVIADHKISPMTVKAARPTSSSSRTPSPKGGGRRIGQISIEASAPQQQGEGPQREEPGRGGTEAAEKTRSVVRSESGESSNSSTARVLLVVQACVHVHVRRSSGMECVLSH